MDESLQELEAELNDLRPRRASAAWSERINRELAAELPAASRPRYTTASNLASWKWLGWRTAGLAAALALVAVTAWLGRKAPGVIPDGTAGTPQPTQDTVIYQPVAATNVLYELKDEGPAKTAAGASARQVRARYVDTYTWKSPRGNASLKWSVPREEIRVMPASFTQN